MQKKKRLTVWDIEWKGIKGGARLQEPKETRQKLQEMHVCFALHEIAL